MFLEDLGFPQRGGGSLRDRGLVVVDLFIE